MPVFATIVDFNNIIHLLFVIRNEFLILNYFIAGTP